MSYNNQDSCTGLAGDSDYIITSNLPYLSHLTFSILEGLLMAFLIFNKALELKFTNNRLFHIRFFLLLSLFFMTVVSDIVWSFYQTKYQINLLIRPIFFALYQYAFVYLYIFSIILISRVVRNAVKNYSVILFKARSMVLVLFLNIIFFSILLLDLHFQSYLHRRTQIVLLSFWFLLLLHQKFKLVYHFYCCFNQ